ncbi:NAD(P)H-dependent glycerol-3-phosphate dehydrogenase [Oscillatoria sp. FACHB-1406]|uniref:NAD(P)H-dependent glycerol-3-phosphate dehydrogenase n=1 Tax=Oscillatoria sp. FACHB-1406 TaxID=2692846 RepID=UPI00168850DE|nr:NAD(P)H-dependent glycerol-3-phosphate dehydrogenase [Oscillatoria sp. FACHB-1406]MBD2577047.1 NAD(P)H-dependent glycerol-3-phosphate dehydrogenase [Oscillatoria sp. FACHB-1406]
MNDELDRSTLKPQPQIVAILGSGVWGTALGTLAARNRHEVRFHSRRSEGSWEDALASANLAVSAVSMSGVRPTIEQLQRLVLPPDLIIVSATKGLDALSLQTPSRIWQAAFPQHPIVVLSGPNLSKEIDRGLPAATAVASEDLEAAKRVQTIFASESFRVYVNADPIGTELGGTLKNIMAIAAGVCDGLNLGTNAKAALLTRALPEIIRVSAHFGATPSTFYGLSGIGDLLATCNSPLSRNYQVGYQLAQGKTLAEILECLEGTAEGINTTEVLVRLAKAEKIEVPIAEQVRRLLEGEITPQQAVHSLMERELKAE